MAAAVPSPRFTAPGSSVPLAIERVFQCALLGMLASGYFALLGTGFLDWPTAYITFAALVARALMVAGIAKFDLPSRAVAALTIAYAGFFPLDYLYVSRSLLSAMVHLILFLAVVKVVTAKTTRDYGYLKIIAGLELLAAAILSFQMSFFLFLALFLLSTIATFSSGEIRSSAIEYSGVVRGETFRFPRRLSLFTVATFLGILVITAGTFFVLPRTARAAFQRLIPRRYHLPGFANEVTLGEIGEIKQSSTPVMHVMPYSGGSVLNARWRGSSLAEFDGKRWFNPPSREDWRTVDRGVLLLGNAPHRRGGRSMVYQVELNDLASDTLFFAGTPESITINVSRLRFSRGGTVRPPPRTFTSGLRYWVRSYLEDDLSPTVAPPDGVPGLPLADYLQLPPLDERIPALAREMTSGATNDFARAKLIETGLQTRYGYTLQLLNEPVSDPLAYFLFVRRKGHCEYFASSMAVMLRTLGIPSRVATGFLSGVFNPMTGWQVIRASDAHSWVEAWIPGQGWTTFDPTPSDPSAVTSGIMSRFSLLLDTADQFWQDWVMGYNLERQVVLASRMGESGRNLQLPRFDELGDWLDSVFKVGWLKGISLRWLAICLAVLCLAAAVWILNGPAILRWWHGRAGIRRARRGQGQPSDATLLYQRMLAQLSKRGIRKPSHVTPQEFAADLPEPGIADLVRELTLSYNEFRFGGRRDVAPRMIQLLERLEQSRQG
jgi:transglutaminase-like putative cysteine protease